MSMSRVDGRHVLAPTVCVGALFDRPINGPKELCALHNEGCLPASTYSLSALDGEFFSEAVSDANPEAAAYRELALRSIELLRGEVRDGALPFEGLMECGSRIQALDAEFAASLFDRDLDGLHRCMGPDRKHPYAKITVLRTTIPVSLGPRVVSFYFEKFLVCYSFLDERGVRRSTVTPIHSHPLNFETVYFTHFGQSSQVVEQEFRLQMPSGLPLVTADGSIDPRFVNAARSGDLALTAAPGPKSTIEARAIPTMLPPFRSEQALTDATLIELTDGLFRAHRVTVVDDPDVETRYFALDNYFGPIARVLLFDEGQPQLWRHGEWE